MLVRSDRSVCFVFVCSPQLSWKWDRALSDNVCWECDFTLSLISNDAALSLSFTVVIRTRNSSRFPMITHSRWLYKRVCPSVRRSVRPSVGPSVRRSVRNAFSQTRARRILRRVFGLDLIWFWRENMLHFFIQIHHFSA